MHCVTLGESPSAAIALTTIVVVGSITAQVLSRA